MYSFLMIFVVQILCENDDNAIMNSIFEFFVHRIRNAQIIHDFLFLRQKKLYMIDASNEEN